MIACLQAGVYTATKCKNSHKIVLASDQVAILEKAIITSKLSLTEDDTYIGEKKFDAICKRYLTVFRLLNI